MTNDIATLRRLLAEATPGPNYCDDRLPERFWVNVFVWDDGCWEWRGSRDRDGYGRMWWGGKTERVHRITYTNLVGAIGDGFQIDHLCLNKWCCNPTHLETVTSKENTRRARPWAYRQDRTHCKHGHEFTDANTRVTKEGHRKCRECDRVRCQRRRDEGKR